MKNHLKQLGKDSIIYGLGGVLAKGISFFLLPVYTRLFSPADYGVIELLAVLNGFLAFLLGMGLDSAQSFYFFEQKENGKTAQTAVISSILHWRIFWGTVIVLSATVLSPLLNHYFFKGELSWEYFAIAFSGSLFAQLTSQSAEVFRLLYRPWKFISITFGQTIISVVATLIMVISLDYGIKGYFLGSLCGSLIMAFVGWFLIRDYWSISASSRMWRRKVLKFGVPLVPAGLAMYILNTSDRWFISHYVGSDALGIYAVGAKFVMLLALAVTTFRQAWWPVALDAMHSDDGPRLFRMIARLYLGCASATIIFLTALSPYLVKWFAAPEYSMAYPVIGVLAWYSVFYGFYLITSVGIWKAEKTALAPILMGIAALLNILLDFLMVPLYGCMGAALATSISFFVWNILAMWLSERLWKVDYPLSVMAAQVSLGMLATGFIIWAYSQNLPLVLIMQPVIVVLFVLMVSSLELKAYKLIFRSVYNFLEK